MITVTCTYCGVRPGIENEHVVGRIFYVNPPKQGITVPSCSECNRMRGDGGPRHLHLDEEYMRNVLCTAEGTRGHPVADALQAKVVRSFHRSVGLRKRLLEGVHNIALKTEMGTIEPFSSPIFQPEWPRIQRVLRKITKGLYYCSNRQTLPEDYVVLVNPVVRPNELPMLMDRLAGLGAFGPETLDEHGVFKFMLASHKGDVARTEWLMRFYDYVVFHTWTLPTAEVADGDTGMPTSRFLEIFK